MISKLKVGQNAAVVEEEEEEGEGVEDDEVEIVVSVLLVLVLPKSDWLLVEYVLSAGCVLEKTDGLNVPVVVELVLVVDKPA